LATFNKVILLGNLTRDPVVKYLPSGQALAELGLAVTHTWYDKVSNTKKEETTFVDVTLWGKTGEIAGQYLAKGRQVLIEGRLKQENWEDKQTGQKRSKMTVVGESMTMVGGGGQGGAGQGGAGGGQAYSQRPPAQGQSPGQPSRPQTNRPAQNYPAEQNNSVNDFYDQGDSSPSPADQFYDNSPDDVPF
jgi:single-strand DNA-binding protein